MVFIKLLRKCQLRGKDLIELPQAKTPSRFYWFLKWRLGLYKMQVLE